MYSLYFLDLKGTNIPIYHKSLQVCIKAEYPAEGLLPVDTEQLIAALDNDIGSQMKRFWSQLLLL